MMKIMLCHQRYPLFHLELIIFISYLQLSKHFYNIVTLFWNLFIVFIQRLEYDILHANTSYNGHITSDNACNNSMGFLISFVQETNAWPCCKLLADEGGLCMTRWSSFVSLIFTFSLMFDSDNWIRFTFAMFLYFVMIASELSVQCCFCLK